MPKRPTARPRAIRLALAEAVEKQAWGDSNFRARDVRPIAPKQLTALVE